MGPRVAVDASVIVRYLTGDDKVQSPEAADLFRAAQAGDVQVVIPTSTVQETVYVLENIYKVSSTDIASKLISLLAIPNVETSDAGWVLEALQFYRAKNSDFGDALLCAYAQTEKCGVATFDKGLMKDFSEVTTGTPADWLSEKARAQAKRQGN